MCFTMFKNHKIPIISSIVTTMTIMSVKTLLRNFLVTSSKCSMFTFTIAETVAKFVFCFLIQGTSPQTLHFNKHSTFLESQFKGPFLICKAFWHPSVVNVTVVLKGSQTKQVFSHMVYIFYPPPVWVTWL